MDARIVSSNASSSSSDRVPPGIFHAIALYACSKAERRSGAEEMRAALAECAGDPSVQVEPRVQTMCAPLLICVRMRASSSAFSGRSKIDQGPGVCVFSCYQIPETVRRGLGLDCSVRNGAEG